MQPREAASAVQNELLNNGFSCWLTRVNVNSVDLTESVVAHQWVMNWGVPNEIVSSKFNRLVVACKVPKLITSTVWSPQRGPGYPATPANSIVPLYSLIDFWALLLSFSEVSIANRSDLHSYILNCGTNCTTKFCSPQSIALVIEQLQTTIERRD